MPDRFQTLNRSFKHRFPFRLSAPSFIYPADYVTNVRLLGPFLDEIELLLFESRRDALPSKVEVAALAALAADLNLTYNVHLPLDLDLGTPQPEIRRDSIHQLAAIIDLVRPLSPTNYTLHLPFQEKRPSDKAVLAWQARTTESVLRLLPLAAVDPRAISIETLDFDPHWLTPLVRRLDLSVCVDVGHAIRFGFDLQALLAHFADRIAILHLHGVLDGRDHLALQPPIDGTMTHYLKAFNGAVSLEVFSFDRLQASLECLAETMGLAPDDDNAEDAGKGAD